MVERTNNSRRVQRATVSSPYKRPSDISKRATEARKGIFGAVTNLFSSFWRKEPETTPEPDLEEDRIDAEPSAAETLVERGLNLQAAQPVNPPLPAVNIFYPPSQPQQPPTMPPPPASTLSPRRSVASPPTDGRTRQIAVVANYLNESLERGLKQREIEACITLLQGSQDDDGETKPEPFRFTATARGTTPALQASGSSSSNGTEAPRRMLAKNPNGTFVWRGGGSSRPRNRYASPSFGTSRSAPALKLSPQKPDGKRRRIDASPEPSTSTAGPSSSSTPSGPNTHLNSSASAPEVNNVSGSSSSIPFPNGARSPSPAAQQPVPVSKLNGTASAPAGTPRLRTAGLKPTAPAIPSPLRQAWGQTDPPSPPQPKAKPTRAANIMSELIKETAPPPKPVFSNPYEDASPVPPRPTRKPPIPRRRAAAGVQAASTKIADTTVEPKGQQGQERKVETELSPQKIIEATLPKGAKRSRPPVDLGKQREQPPIDSGPRRSARLKSPEPSRSNGISHVIGPIKDGVVVEEVSDEDEPSPTKKTKANGSSGALRPALEIKERSSIQIEEVGDTEMFSPTLEVVVPTQVVEPEQPVKERSTSPTSAPTPFTFGSNSGTTRPALGIKSSAPKAPSKLRYSFQVDKDEKIQESGTNDAPNLNIGFPSFYSRSNGPEVLATPAIEISAPMFPIPPKLGPAVSSSVVEKPTPKTTEEIKAAVSALPVSELPQYTFDFSLSSPGAGSSTEEAKAAAMAVPVSDLPTFDFTTPPVPVDSSTPAPAASTSTSFNWAAAGLKPPSKPSDSWDCSECTLNNPATATAKCQFCDAPRASSSAPAPAPVPASAPVMAFDWAAAGMKPPTTSAGWKCSTCMLDNPDSASKCTVCETPR